MTVRIKSYYKNVNGRLVLVHEHDKNIQAKKEEIPEHNVTSDDFESAFDAFKDIQPEAEQAVDIPEPSQDDFDAAFADVAPDDIPQVADADFDAMFNDVTPEEAAQETEQAPETAVEFDLATLEAIGGKEWKSDDGGKHRVYFNGIPALWEAATGKSAATHGKGTFKSSKVFYDFADHKFHSKNLDENTASDILTHLEEKALAAASNKAKEDPQAKPKPVDTAELKPGEKPAFSQLKEGMKLQTPSGGGVTVGPISPDGGATLISDKDGVKATIYPENPNSVDTSAEPKVGEHVPFDQLKVGMKLKSKFGADAVVTTFNGAEVGIDKTGASGNVLALVFNEGDWNKVGYTLAEDQPEGGATKAGPKVGDTKTENGRTYVFNANHRWELVEQGEAKPWTTQGNLDGLEMGASQTLNGIVMKKSPKSGNMLVYKKDADDKPLPKKVKDALKELHPAGYKTNKAFFVVDKDKFAELAAIIDGKAESKPKVKKPKMAPIHPITVGDSFPYTQIGPQAGSNEGGLYQDAFGKKWYIKFPASEDHAKNELLAAKLYKLCGIDVPHLKLVKKDGKIGIASGFQEGLKNDGSALKAGADGAKGGFGVDAWLANWDSVGLSYDNMPVKDGKAFRVDVGGSLLYRAQGGPKGEAFGNVVTEIDSLRNPATNPQTASVFGSMSDEELNRAVAKVLEVPDDAIHAAVMKFGPGDDAAKKALIKKLQARKAYLAKRFPEADALANPPAPDPTHLRVDPAKIGDVPNFHDWKGSGKGLSSNEAINTANKQACQEIHDYALKGNLVDLKAMKMPVIDKTTGAAVMKPAYEHPSQWVREYYDTIVGDLEVIANPAASKEKAWDLEDAEDIRELSDAFPAHLYGVSVAKIPANERLGFWISLGNVSGPETFKPKAVSDVSSSLKSLVKKSYAGLTDKVKSWLGSVQSAGNNNQPYRDGSETDYQGRNTRDVLEGAYSGALEFPEGTTIRKWITLPADMEKQIAASPEGHVFQNPGSMCCSMSDKWEGGLGSGFGNHLLTIRYAKGAKALPTAGSGAFGQEQEITTLPGQRFMLLGQSKLKDGSLHLELLMLPPDETYVANIKPKQVAA